MGMAKKVQALSFADGTTYVGEYRTEETDDSMLPMPMAMVRRWIQGDSKHGQGSYTYVATDILANTEWQKTWERDLF